MKNDRRKRLGKGWRIFLFAAMVIVGGGVGYYVFHQRQAAEEETTGPTELTFTLTEAEALTAVQLKDTSIGHLENGTTETLWKGEKICSMDLAAIGFEELAKQLPSEVLPVQDLAIARYLLLNDAQKDIEQARETARQAAQRLIEFDPNQAVAYWLAALVELKADPSNPLAVTEEVRAKAVALLQRATELEPDNAVFWFALKEGATDRSAGDPPEIAKTALAKAYALKPRNIYLLTEQLMMQSAAEDPEIKETFAAAKDVLKSIMPAVKRSRRINIDLNERIDVAVKAVDEDQWRTVQGTARILNNVVRPEEVAKSDIKRVDVHPLEFLCYEFSDDFYAEYGRPAPAWDKATSAALHVGADDTLASLSGVVDLRVMDFTLNGLPDILVLQPGMLRLLGREKLDGPWVELTSLDVPVGMTHLLTADLDRDRQKTASAPSVADPNEDAAIQYSNVVSATDTCHDADPDIVLYGADGVMVLRNDWSSEEDGAKLVSMENVELQQLTHVSRGVLIDLDHDGELDLIFSSAEGVTIWQAGADFTYVNTSEFSQLPPPQVAVTTMVAVDWDRDADIDVVLGDPTGTVTGYLENMRHGEFRWTAFEQEYGQLNQPEQVALLEADGNVSWDLLTVGMKGVQLYLTSTPSAGIVNFQRASKISEDSAAGVLTWDFDNDGYRDAATWGETGLTIWRGSPDAAFALADVVTGTLEGTIRAVVQMDIDRDGDQDLVVATDDHVVTLDNQGGSGHGWITLFPMGQSDNKGRCNHHAIGSLIELRSGGWYQAQVVDSSTVHFGLGAEKTAQQLRILWTNGVPQDIVDMEGNVAICEQMVLKGSCPYVYTMADGEFSFFTDCLWAAPIGMQTSEGTIAPTRSWEYLLIPGERLTAHEGSYWVMMTEELWEAGYFDKVQLIAVDHPADVEIFSNEKVGPPSVASAKTHTVSQRRVPIAAVDQQGRDVMKKLSQRDGDFVKAFEQRIRQGLTPEHYIELDLGELDDPQQVTLFLTGWILPTDTSLNVAFAQDPETDGPRMPAVMVPDAQGVWQETVAYMGFPGGKTKTIAVDLSKAFLTSDYRVRIKTTAEIYWDEAFFTVDEPTVELKQIPLDPVSAEVAYRGISQEIPRPDEAPQMYDAQVVRRTPVWPPMRGKFTRYGEVTELIAEGDDRMVVLGAGDAMTIRFAVPKQAPPAGWRRDFLLHSIGWDKDADLNTIYGQTVEPLPYRAMKSYPFDPAADAPGGDVYEQYLLRYQTREQDPRAFWRHLVLPRNEERLAN